MNDQAYFAMEQWLKSIRMYNLITDDLTVSETPCEQLDTQDQQEVEL